MELNINTDAVVKFTNNLEKLHRSALPSAVRGSLNKAAFDMKQKTLLETTKSIFATRQSNFFKANSKVEPAQGFNLNTMQAIVGMISSGLKGNNFAVKDLEAQEDGGTIDKKSFIPLSPARTGKNPNKLVRANERLSSIKKIVDAKKAQGKNDKEKFVKSVLYAGAGGAVLAKYKGKEILWRVNSLNKTAGGNFKLTALYSYRPGRKVHVKASHFMEKSGLKSASKIEEFFIAEAERQFAKFNK